MAEPQTPLTLVDWLDDLCVRFLLNLPSSELSSIPRICFQVEEAQWFYEDFVRPAVQASGAPPLPSIPLRQFCLLLFQHCPLLSGFTGAQHIAAYDEFLAYKVRVPVRGAILLDESMEKLVLVRGWKKGASWSFPRGKINKDEKDLDCAIREVYEETGFDLSTSGLIPEDEEDLKYIDITMREQHMRLFVFRGVPEDTHFETKTRKEISKISWYWVKDLPGFKKQAKHQQHSEAETQHASRFYMVAPFLSPLKKWINFQRKKDAVEAQRKLSASHDFAAINPHAVAEDESEDYQPLGSHGISVGQKEDGLRRLLNMHGGPTSSPQPSKPDAHAGNLLAMLQGGSNAANGGRLPHTPFEQINAFPPQPETPHPHHLRHPSLHQQQNSQPPSFPFSPQRMQQEQQRNFSLPTPNVFGPGGPHAFPQNQGPGFAPGMLPPHLQQQQFQHRPQMSNPMPFGQHNVMPANGPSRPPMPPTQMPPPSYQQIPPPTANATREPQSAIGGGPSVPNASQLPAPNLNPHTMRLLDAFKSGSNQPSPTMHTSNKTSARPSSTHQAALLGLFKRPSTSTAPSAQPSAAEEPTSPAQTDMTEKPRRPSKGQERRPTLNEITRTLPPKPKAKATSPIENTAAQQLPPDDRPKSRQLFDPDRPEKLTAATDEVRIAQNQAEQKSPIRILQRPSPKQSQQPLTAPNPSQTSPSTASVPAIGWAAVKSKADREVNPEAIWAPAPAGSWWKKNKSRPNLGPSDSEVKALNEGPTRPHKSPKPRQAASPSLRDNTSKENGSRPSSFTLLTRPGSSRGSNPPAVASPVSPLRQDTPKAMFQPQLLKRPQTAEAERKDDGLNKTDQLLALFSTTSTSDKASPASQAQQSAPERKTPQPNDNGKTALLDLFNTSAAPQESASSPAPPPAPKIQPSTQSNHTTSTTSQNKQQSLLLDLFNKPSGTPTASPGTPISPFTLGTPATTRPLKGLTTTASPTSSGGTPVEAKEFLMGYLNGVVKNEGYRGAGSKR